MESKLCRRARDATKQRDEDAASTHTHTQSSALMRDDRKRNATNRVERPLCNSATSHSGMPNDCTSVQAVAAWLLIPKRASYGFSGSSEINADNAVD